MALLSLFRHWHFLSQTFDLGFYTQNVWVIGHGLWHNTVGGYHVFADHFSPILVLLAPAAYLPVPEALLVIQAAAVGLGIFPAYRVGARHGGPRLGRLAAAWYGLSAGIWFAVAFDFHPFTVAVPLLMWLIDEVDSETVTMGPLLAALALTFVREDMAILAAVVLIQGAYLYRRRRLALWALIPAAMGVGYTIWISLSPGEMGGYQLWGRFFSGAGSGSIAESVTGLIGNLTRPDPLVAFGALLLPMLVFPVFMGWRRSWPGLAIMLLNGLASYGAQTSLYYQYFAPAVPLLIWGSVHAFGKGAQSRKISPSYGSSLMATIVVFVLLGPIVYFGYGASDRYASVVFSSGDRRVLSEVITRVDSEAAVSATDRLLPHLANRMKVYPFPAPMLCLSSSIFQIPRTFYPPVIAVEWGNALPGPDWEAELRSWGYAPAYQNDLAAVWQLEGEAPPSVPCLSIAEQRRAASEPTGSAG